MYPEYPHEDYILVTTLSTASATEQEITMSGNRTLIAIFRRHSARHRWCRIRGSGE
jgi:hypothetical protein